MNLDFSLILRELSKFNLMVQQVVILAGGLATRLGELVKDIPKSLININGTPFIFYQLEYLKSQGFKNIHLCLSHKKELIIDTLDQNNNLGLNISFSFDGKKQLGTGGALINALEYLEDEFLVQYGDTYLPIDYNKIISFYAENNRYNILTVFKNQNKYDQSNIILDQNNIVLYDKDLYDEKMEYIDYGLSLLKKDTLKEYDCDGFIDLSSVYKALITKKELIAFEVYQRFYEIGKPDGIKETEKFLKST